MNFSTIPSNQNIYYIPTGTKIHILDNTNQAIFKVSFNVGEIETDVVDNYTVFTNEIRDVNGDIIKFPNQTNQPLQTDVKYPVSKLYALNNYINNSYTIEEKATIPSKYIENLLFSLRTLDAPSASHSYPDGSTYYLDGETQLNSFGYFLFIDQVVYDSELKSKLFLKDDTNLGLNIKTDDVSNTPYVGQSLTYYDPVGVTIDRASFVPYAEQKTIAENIMSNKIWIRKFADKHKLLVFKSNNVDLNPRILFAIKLEEARKQFSLL